MLKISFALLCDDRFRHTMVQLSNCRDLDAVTALRVGRICQAADKNKSKIEKLEHKIEMKFLQKDAKGEPLKDEQGQPCWNSPTAQDECIEEKKVELEKHFIEVNKKIEFAKLAPAKLSGLMMTIIEDVVEGMPKEA